MNEDEPIETTEKLGQILVSENEKDPSSFWENVRLPPVIAAADLETTSILCADNRLNIIYTDGSAQNILKPSQELRQED